MSTEPCHDLVSNRKIRTVHRASPLGKGVGTHRPSIGDWLSGFNSSETQLHSQSVLTSVDNSSEVGKEVFRLVTCLVTKSRTLWSWFKQKQELI